MNQSDASPQGRVIASYGQRGVLDPGDGSKRRYLLKGRRLKAVCGDLVDWTSQKDSAEALVTAVRERENVLERPNSAGHPELIAANLSRLLVVLAPAPEPDFFLADRYLCSAEMMGVTGLIVWNKTDIAPHPPTELGEYHALGYELIAVSCKADSGINALNELLNNGINMLVGQSGVGKSSLINMLVPDAGATIGELSQANREGRHTTTASYMHELLSGGSLIDSPGVREFSPVIPHLQNIARGFREIDGFANQCRFSDCQHLREPNCAVKEAVEEGKIAGRRYESYKRLSNTLRALKN